MNSFINDMKHNYFISALVTVILGLVLVIWPDVSGKLLCYTLGVALMIMGAIQLISFLKGKRIGIMNKFALGMALVIILLGLLVCANPQAVLSVIPMIVGIIMILHGFMDIIYSLDIKNTGASKWWIALITSLITLFFGLFLALKPYFAYELTMTIIGIALLYDGGSDLLLVIVSAYKQKQSDKRVREFTENVEAKQDKNS